MSEPVDPTLPLVLFGLLVVGLVWLLLRPRQPRQAAMPKTPPPPKPLPPELRPKPSGTAPVADNDPLRPHLFELVAAAINENAEVKWWDLRDLNYEGRPLPNFRITIERIND
ncbi:hypothetical protein [Methylobacterium aquaticum]|uniref:Uncharacterized protein n=1 Tax=Methylobacterium aquaticum TaxID=270351 RepID=A0A0C6G2F8_9HYPH|nr:hypothetical protein [Methylobacterium aquaticum]BAQ50270.1 hypothetical protein Maq22A_3p50075 [Methylobacterium aquaticum]